MKGIGVSPGVSIGKAFVIREKKAVLTNIVLKDEEEILREIKKYDHAVCKAIEEIELIKTALEVTGPDEALEIVETQIELISDPQIRTNVAKKITDDKKNANDALIESIDEIVQLFINMKDEYMRARSADIKDIGGRILRYINGSFQTEQREFENNTILIAEDISPSETMTMDLKHIIGFATQIGGKTSHAAIIAKLRGIPAVVGCGDQLKSIMNNDVIIVDGTEGLIIANPDKSIIEAFKIKRDLHGEKSTFLKSLRETPADTVDGKKIKLLANISGPEDMEDVFDNGGEGVGLLRTEFLFMERNSFPDEGEQFEFYKRIALQSRNKPIIIRTLDIGGDKHLPYFGLPVEQNPFLGYRAIRICLDRKDIFITQLKAILRASIFGKLKIMFPMICHVQEVRLAKEILREAKNELANEHIKFDENIEIGIMIEIPSAAVTADILAKEVDFFSIGTNDLCQYTLAVDRMNEKIKDLYDPFNPGVLRLINNVIEQGHKHNIHVGMCGELASDPLATLLLLGMGLDEFSMAATSIPTVKNIIINNHTTKAKEVYEKVMNLDNSKDIITYLEGINK